MPAESRDGTRGQEQIVTTKAPRTPRNANLLSRNLLGALGVLVVKESLWIKLKIRPHPGPLPADRAREKSGTGLEFVGCRQGRSAAAGTPLPAESRDGTRGQEQIVTTKAPRTPRNANLLSRNLLGALGVLVVKESLWIKLKIRPHPGPLPADRAREKSGTGLEFVGCRQGRLAAAGTPCMAGGVSGRDSSPESGPDTFCEAGRQALGDLHQEDEDVEQEVTE